MTLLKLLLLASVVCAPRLKDKPLEYYERQLAVGKEVFGGDFGWVVITETTTDSDGFHWVRFSPNRPFKEWDLGMSREAVAKWLRDFPENRKRR